MQETKRKTNNEKKENEEKNAKEEKTQSREDRQTDRERETDRDRHRERERETLHRQWIAVEPCKKACLCSPGCTFRALVQSTQHTTVALRLGLGNCHECSLSKMMRGST